ncbi:MAG TPA: histidine phosphatase family protein [Egibacteraceae bacterium]|jgi:broad specificity phosphatase PhoE|nr:histidine phosphatase family protein [Egibacteraceae bacterium]
MPADLVLVRHGRSEGNEARERSKKGDERHYTPAFRSRRNREWRLTDAGIQQARAAGAWIVDNVARGFFRYATSEYLRARETAAHLGLPEARWTQDILLRERSWGHADFIMPESERFELFAAQLAARREDPCYWRPPDGESLAEVCLRVERVLDRLRRECAGQRCILVTHEDVMWAARFILEGLTQERWREMLLSGDPREKIHNGQVLHYTRRHPGSGELGPRLQWVRSVCPWDPDRSGGQWQQVAPPSFTNDELLASVAAVPRLVAGEALDRL